MTKMPNLLISGVMLISIACSFAAADAQEYATYCNARYGFCVSHPGHLKMEPPPENDDGRCLLDGQGLSITVSGINNVSDGTLQSEMNFRSEAFDKITYRINRDDWFILSGYKGNDILYVKTYIGKGSINNLQIVYPANRKTAYDGIVDKISRSFKPGSLNISH